MINSLLLKNSFCLLIQNFKQLSFMKENVICGHLIPAGTGLRQWDKLIVGSKEDHERMEANRKNVLDYADPIID